MSKAIIIQINGVEQNVTADKIRTHETSGGSCTWIPEDSVTLMTKTIDGSGEFKAEDDNVYGYDQVIVIGKSGNAAKVVNKSVHENGVYKPADEPAYGFSSVYVSVRGGGSFVDPDTGETITPEPATDDGSGVEGYNPDGNEELVEIEGGKIKRTLLVSYISLDTPPTKTTYADGEAIDMTGAVVNGYLRDETLYAPGVQVTADPATAEYSSGGQQTITLKWDRDGDGKTLETTMDITVTE